MKCVQSCHCMTYDSVWCMTTLYRYHINVYTDFTTNPVRPLQTDPYLRDPSWWVVPQTNYRPCFQFRSPRLTNANIFLFFLFLPPRHTVRTLVRIQSFQHHQINSQTITTPRSGEPVIASPVSSCENPKYHASKLEPNSCSCGEARGP